MMFFHLLTLNLEQFRSLYPANIRRHCYPLCSYYIASASYRVIRNAGGGLADIGRPRSGGIIRGSPKAESLIVDKGFRMQGESEI